MTVQQAINILISTRLEDINKTWGYGCALGMGIEALNKQIPKKAKATNHHTSISFRCPVCSHGICYEDDLGNLYAGRRENYCPDCGQALDWSDNK